MNECLLQLRKRSGPKIEPCGTPALIDFQIEAPAGSTTLRASVCVLNHNARESIDSNL